MEPSREKHRFPKPAAFHVRHLLLYGLFCLACLLPTCSSERDNQTHLQYEEVTHRTSDTPLYKFAVHPLHNPKRLFAAYQPLMDAVNAKARGFQIKLVASRDYAAYERKLYAGLFDFALPNPLQTINSVARGYRIIGKMGDDQNFRGLIITRKDAGIFFVEDLAGKPLSFPAPTALAATMLPKTYLKSRGLNIEEASLLYVGSQESAIMNVYLGKTVAAGTWPLPWRQLTEERPEIGKVLKVQWETEHLVNNGLVAHKRIPTAHMDQFMDILASLQDTPEGEGILRGIHISNFERCSSDAYLPVVQFISTYTRLFPNEVSLVQP